MSLYVKKFGGSSVATPEKMLNIAKKIYQDGDIQISDMLSEGK